VGLQQVARGLEAAKDLQQLLFHRRDGGGRRRGRRLLKAPSFFK
jgi:hypothetical protein